jgi:hypothetical protein
VNRISVWLLPAGPASGAPVKVFRTKSFWTNKE